MTRRFLIILFVLASFALRCFTQNISNEDRLRDAVRKYGQVEVTIPFTDYKTLDILTRKVSILSVRNKVVEISLSPLTVEWFILQKLDYQIIIKADKEGVNSAMNVNQAMEWDTYPTYSQYDSIMQSFNNLYPALCHLDTIGTSVNGKLVLVLKISDNVSIDEDEPEVFYTSTMHGDETGGFILMLRFTDYLLKNYNLNSRVKNLVDNLQIWINPLANPDGAYKNSNTISSLSSTRYNANGVDLNRNFPDPSQPLEVQEKENIDMIKFLREHKFVISANFHSGAEVVNYPWDRWDSKFHADDSWFRMISRDYADTVHNYSSRSYMNYLDNGVTRGADWYVIYGGRQDFVTYELQGREVTIELDDQYITPNTQLPRLWHFNWHSLIGCLENALNGIHGHVSDAASSLPLKAKVFIPGHDKDSSQVYSDNVTGSFVRMLYPGSWDLTFSAAGFYDLTIDNIIVLPGQKSDLTVNMVPISNSIDTSSQEQVLMYPNPATTEIKAVLPDRIIGHVNIKIINQSGMLVSDYDTEAIQDMPVKIDIKWYPSGIYSIIFTNRITRIATRGRFIVIK